MFFGYSPTQKDYRCFDSLIKKSTLALMSPFPKKFLQEESFNKARLFNSNLSFPNTHPNPTTSHYNEPFIERNLNLTKYAGT